MMVRLINAIPFIVILLMYGGWSVGFFALQASDLAVAAENLRCLTFFGGMVLTSILGAIIGSFFKRLIWKAMSNRGNPSE